MLVRTRVKSRFDRSIVIPIFSPSLFSSFLSIYSRQPYEYQRRSVICAEIKWRETIIFYAKRFTMDRGELEISCDEKYDDFFFFFLCFPPSRDSYLEYRTLFQFLYQLKNAIIRSTRTLFGLTFQ